MLFRSGHVLVQGKVARHLDTEPVLDNSGYNKVVWADTRAVAEISDGSLGALIELRDVDLRNELQSLDTMTMNFLVYCRQHHQTIIRFFKSDVNDSTDNLNYSANIL